MRVCTALVPLFTPKGVQQFVQLQSRLTSSYRRCVLPVFMHMVSAKPTTFFLPSVHALHYPRQNPAALHVSEANEHDFENAAGKHSLPISRRAALPHSSHTFKNVLRGSWEGTTTGPTDPPPHRPAARAEQAGGLWGDVASTVHQRLSPTGMSPGVVAPGSGGSGGPHLRQGYRAMAAGALGGEPDGACTACDAASVLPCMHESRAAAPWVLGSK